MREQSESRTTPEADRRAPWKRSTSESASGKSPTASEPDLAVWMNGERVGTWRQTSAGVDLLEYEEDWLRSPHSRPLSLTLPFLPGNDRTEVST